GVRGTVVRPHRPVPEHRKPTLHPNELRTLRIAVLIEPVSISEPQRVVVGLIVDRPEEQFVSGWRHGESSSPITVLGGCDAPQPPTPLAPRPSPPRLAELALRFGDLSPTYGGEVGLAEQLAKLNRTAILPTSPLFSATRRARPLRGLAARGVGER